MNMWFPNRKNYFLLIRLPDKLDAEFNRYTTVEEVEDDKKKKLFKRMFFTVGFFGLILFLRSRRRY